MNPQKNLIHTAILYKQVDTDADNNVFYSENGFKINCLIIKKKIWSPGSSDGLGPTAYQGADIAISNDISVCEGDKIVYCNVKYVVESVNDWLAIGKKKPPLLTLKCRDYGAAQ